MGKGFTDVVDLLGESEHKLHDSCRKRMGAVLAPHQGSLKSKKQRLASIKSEAKSGLNTWSYQAKLIAIYMSVCTFLLSAHRGMFSHARCNPIVNTVGIAITAFIVLVVAVGGILLVIQMGRLQKRAHYYQCILEICEEFEEQLLNDKRKESGGTSLVE